MTDPSGFDLLELATPYALNAVSENERVSIDQQLATSPGALINAFGDEVRAVREAMAVVSATTAAEPPDRVRAAVLARVDQRTGRQSRWRTVILAAAAAIVVALAAFGAGLALRTSPTPTRAEQIMAASDVRTVSRTVVGGTATVVFSRNIDAGVLLMNNVPPPTSGNVYQMWLLDDAKAPLSAGTMDTAAVTPSTTQIVSNLGNSRALAFTVEPGTGSPQPTGKIFAELPLT